jgi:hypothetical protein
MTRNQLNEISAFIELFGIDKIGLSRTLSRIFLRNYFKNYGGKTELEAKSLAIPSSQFGLREI